MSNIDDGMQNDRNRIQTGVATSMEIHGEIRKRAMAECVTKVNSTKAAKSKHLNFGSLEVDEVTDEKGDIALGHYDIGASYVTKKEYAKRICISGKEMRRMEVGTESSAAMALNEGMDATFDRAMIDAACGQMLVGDECKLQVLDVSCCIEHGDQGITPEKIVEATTLLMKMNNGNARPVIPFTSGMSAQLTAFDEFTHNDFMIDGMPSAYTNSMMRQKGGKWFGATFKQVFDRRMRDVTQKTCPLQPIIKAEPYIVNGNIVPNKFVRYIPVFDAKAIKWETGYDVGVSMYPIWKERGKPKGTSEMRIDAEFGMGRTDNCGVVIMKIVEECKLLKV